MVAEILNILRRDAQVELIPIRNAVPLWPSGVDFTDHPMTYRYGDVVNDANLA